MGGQCHHHGGRRAVRVGDQVAVAFPCGVGVGLGHDQRDVVGKAEGARVVDHQRHRCAGPGHDLAALRAIHGEEEHIQLRGVGVVEHVHRHRCPAVLDRISLLVAEGAQALGRQAGIGQDGAEHPSHHASCAGHADGRPSVHAVTIHACGRRSLAPCFADARARGISSGRARMDRHRPARPGCDRAVLRRPLRLGVRRAWLGGGRAALPRWLSGWPAGRCGRLATAGRRCGASLEHVRRRRGRRRVRRPGARCRWNGAGRAVRPVRSQPDGVVRRSDRRQPSASGSLATSPEPRR